MRFLKAQGEDGANHQSIFRITPVALLFLQNILQIEADKADKTACRMEHVIDEDTLDAFIPV